MPQVWEKIGRANEHEPYRAKITFMHQRIRNMLEVRPGPRYTSSQEMLLDLHMMQGSLRENKASEIADAPVEDLVRQVETFGLHLASLDVRELSGKHALAVAAILKEWNIAFSYYDLIEAEKLEALNKGFRRNNGRNTFSRATGEALEILRLFQSIKRWQRKYGADALRTYIVSMTETPSDFSKSSFSPR